MKKISFQSLTEFEEFKNRFKSFIVYIGNEDNELFIVIKDYIINQLIEDEGFDDVDFKPVFVNSIGEVEKIRDNLGNPRYFHFRYFKMKKQYLVTC